MVTTASLVAMESRYLATEQSRRLLSKDVITLKVKKEQTVCDRHHREQEAMLCF